METVDNRERESVLHAEFCRMVLKVRRPPLNAHRAELGRASFIMNTEKAEHSDSGGILNQVPKQACNSRHSNSRSWTLIPVSAGTETDHFANQCKANY